MKKLIVAAIICALPYAARADMTGKRLKEFCQQHHSLCTGYIWGSVETARVLKVACEPPGVSGARLIDMATKYLLAHPEQWHLTASSLIIDMYKSEFPCPPNPS